MPLQDGTSSSVCTCHLWYAPKPLPAPTLYRDCVPTVGSLCRVFLPPNLRKSLAVQLPDIPLEAFKTCTGGGPLGLWIVPHAIGVTFGKSIFSSLVATPSRSLRVVSDISAFCIIIWLSYSSVLTFQVSALLRTVVAGATVYFIIAMALQTLVLLFLSFADVCRRPLPVLIL